MAFGVHALLCGLFFFFFFYLVFSWFAFTKKCGALYIATKLSLKYVQQQQRTNKKSANARVQCWCFLIFRSLLDVFFFNVLENCESGCFRLQRKAHFFFFYPIFRLFLSPSSFCHDGFALCALHDSLY